MMDKYAIIEWESYGQFDPVVIETGRSFWRLWHKLNDWRKASPRYVAVSFVSISGYAERQYLMGSKPLKTTRKIIRIGEENE